MDSSNTITSGVFSAFLKCQTKAHLLMMDEHPPSAFFSDIEVHIASLYRTEAKRQIRITTEIADFLEFGQLRHSRDHRNITHYVDCESAAYDFTLPQQNLGIDQLQGTPPSRTFIPILFLPWAKPGLSDILLVCFGALALSQTTGILADTGKLVYGESYCHRAVRICDHVAQVRQAIDKMRVTQSGEGSPLFALNRHCAVCDWKSRCYNLAVECDDLSLLAALTGKERTKFNAKGIFTITQLSYGYRPRRRKRARPEKKDSTKYTKRATQVVRNDHKLRALAIKKSQIHVVGTPALKFEGIPTFLDVEGMPDRNFYYLVGLRFKSGGEQVEHSFWADGMDDERVIWENCLKTLKAIGNPQIVSYGAYETRFFRRMKLLYTSVPSDIEFIDRLIETSVNLVGCIYGKVYFPTFSNSLKEVARYLGYEWKWSQGSGVAALLLRRAWELSADDKFKCALIDYNIDDLRASTTVADALLHICRGDASELDAVNVASLEVSFQRTFGKFNSVLPDFEKINKAAYWDYQRSKVYIRTHKPLRKIIGKSKYRSRNAKVEQEVRIDDKPQECLKCHATRFWTLHPRDSNGSHIVYDLKFTRKGIKRWAVQYFYSTYRCSRCHKAMTPYVRPSKYGPNLRAFVVYLLIELRLSYSKVAEHVSLLFDVSLPKASTNEIKSDMAEKYLPTYRGILRQIAKGTLVHADETKGVVRSEGHYVWVFANMTTVAYVYAESREADTLHQVLDGFSGVLVSDFYAAYDSVPCVQQKCLIHLMRDINEDLHKNPFNEELKEIAWKFGTLLREIVESIDMYGLKRRHLGKHRKSAMGFIETVLAMECATEPGLALKKRIEKNRNKLFTFLDYDGVPWNNNNAEHAIQAFMLIRNAIITSTPKGTRDFATLLSVQQTLRYRGKNFLEFMRSDRMEIDD